MLGLMNEFSLCVQGSGGSSVHVLGLEVYILSAIRGPPDIEIDVTNNTIQTFTGMILQTFFFWYPKYQ